MPFRTAIKKYLPILLSVFMFHFCVKPKTIRRPLAIKKINNWVCVYNDRTAPADLKKFDLAVLDADAHPDLQGLKNSQTVLVGYVSLGEVGTYRWYWPQIANKPWVVQKNPNWDSYFIDVRAPEWQQWLISKIIPNVLAQGFDGIFLDTIDNAEYLEKYHPGIKYPGAQQSMIALIRAIRKRFPDIFIIANRGFSLLDEMGRDIDGIVAESLFTTILFQAEQGMKLRPPSEYQPVVEQLVAAQKKFNLLIFTLDYLAPENQQAIQSIIQKARNLNFVPYISTAKLDSVFYFTL
ncbi:MAG: endo alpha-1,4 polygalactosaminidase [bacterium]